MDIVIQTLDKAYSPFGFFFALFASTQGAMSDDGVPSTQFINQRKSKFCTESRIAVSIVIILALTVFAASTGYDYWEYFQSAD